MLDKKSILREETIVFALTVARKHSARADRIVVSAFSVILIGCEVFKQLFWFEFYGYYRFEIFPFQFCSTPMFVGALTGIFRKGRVHEALCAYLATFAFFAGLSVGSNVVIARYIGKNDASRVQAAVHTTVCVALISGVAVAAAGVILIRPLLVLVQTPADIIAPSNSFFSFT